MFFPKNKIDTFLKTLALLTGLSLGFSIPALAGDGPPPPPRDAPKTQQEFIEHLTLAEKGEAYSQYVVCLAYYDGRVIKETNYAAAIDWCTLAANQGLAKAQFYMGYFYSDGGLRMSKVIKRNTEKALYWFQFAAEQGDNHARYKIGEIYENRRNHTKAIEWYELAGARNAIETLNKRYQQFAAYVTLANAGDAEAQFSIFYACINGFINNGKSDYRESVYGNIDTDLIKEHCSDPVSLGILAANQGYYPAQYYLGRFYLHGNGVEKDIEQALYWFQLAAENENHGGAEDYLGDAYKNGNGVEKNIDQAIYWYELAAKKGNSYARTKLRQLRGEQQ